MHQSFAPSALRRGLAGKWLPSRAYLVPLDSLGVDGHDLDLPASVELPEVARAREAMKPVAFIGHFSLLNRHSNSKVVRINSSLW